MLYNWQDAFTQFPGYFWKDKSALSWPASFSVLENLKQFLDVVHIKHCLLQPYFEIKDYPLVAPQELMPSFETNLYEYPSLPGFSLVVLDRTISYFQEVFQFDLLHCVEDALRNVHGPASAFEPAIIQYNKSIFQSRLPKHLQDKFKKELNGERITDIQNYPRVLPYILNMDRGHVLAQNAAGDFYLSGIYASFPSDLDTELKRFGLKIGKFKPGDNRLYEINRYFVYQFLMELYGFPIASERRTSAALFARRLLKMGEDFLVRVLGESDRTITSLYTTQEATQYPQVEKIALVRLDASQKEQLQQLREGGFLIEGDEPVAILKLSYKQHNYDPKNIRTDRALSVSKQEVIHPLTGRVWANVNIVKDPRLMTYILNDIVKGEYRGRVRYKRNEIVENTDTHEKRLKFLYAWLKKHQRRIVSYSDEFYHRMTKVLDNYLQNEEHNEEFKALFQLYQEVWEQYSYIQQARKVKALEDIARRHYKGKKLNYLQMLKQASAILHELKFEAVRYFETIIEQIIHITEQMLNDSYLKKKYLTPAEDQLTPYGRSVRKLYGRTVNLLDDFYAIRKSQSVSTPSETGSVIKYVSSAPASDTSDPLFSN